MDNRLTQFAISVQKGGLDQQSSGSPRGGSDKHLPAKKKDHTHDLKLPGIVESGKRSGIAIRKESPWETLREIYQCDLAGEIMVVVKKSKPKKIYVLKKFSGPGQDEIHHRLSSIRHINLASAKDFFATIEGLFTLSDFFPLTLEHVVACQHYPNEIELNAIMSQVLNGLSYIVSQNLEHTSLECSGILMDNNGNIKIGISAHYSMKDSLNPLPLTMTLGRLEKCVLRAAKKPQKTEMRCLANIMMELLQKYVKDDGNIGIDDLDRWPSDSVPVEFLLATTVSDSVGSLMKHPLISKIPFNKDTLVGLSWFAVHSTKTFWSYTL